MRYGDKAIRVATLTLIGGIFLLGACGFHDRPNHTVQTLLYIAVAYDVSGSVEQLDLPVMTAEHIDRTVFLVKRRGGTIAFGLIDEKAFEPLIRLELERVAGKLDERARINQRNKKAETEFKTTVAERLRRKTSCKRHLYREGEIL